MECVSEKQCENRKAILLVLDSAGIGALPDADLYGDNGANTLQRIAAALPDLELPYFNGLGLHRLVPQFAARQQMITGLPAYTASMAERSKGKDTITGHWELAGVITEEPSPTFPQGFPQAFLRQLYDATGYHFLGNEAASGTEIIARLGAAHVKTKQPILYTSADSVLQIAAHEDVISVAELYGICQIARELTKTGPYKVGRVIARPFSGAEGNYQRTANRHDFALSVPLNNLLHDLLQQHHQVFAVGKIADIFAGTKFTRTVHTSSNTDGMDRTMDFYRHLEQGLLFTNLVDFDMKYGHRRDTIGYGQALADFDVQLGQLIQQMDADTILIITADHGCDPGFRGTDHTREYVPLLICGQRVKPNQKADIHSSFADLAATLADYFQIDYSGAGASFYQEVLQ